MAHPPRLTPTISLNHSVSQSFVVVSPSTTQSFYPTLLVTIVGFFTCFCNCWSTQRAAHVVNTATFPGRAKAPLLLYKTRKALLSKAVPQLNIIKQS